MSHSNSKRSFLKKSLVVGAGLPLLSSGLLSCGSGEQSKPLRILILGGTSFLGPHQVAYAISRGHQVSTFTRGKTKPTVQTKAFEQVEMLIGDRVDNLSALENREWDVVIDNSGRAADWTQRTAELLKDSASLYLYVSSTGVYYPHLEANVDEDTPVLMQDPVNDNGEVPARDSFGVMKAKSEQEAIKAFGADRTAVVRPTYMWGPADRTDRFVHWPLRLEKGGEVMVPGKTGDPVQYIDVRDVAEWIIRLAEARTAGTFNAVGPAENQDIMAFVSAASQAFEAESELIQVDDYPFLQEQGIQYLLPWIMPNGDYFASARVKNQKAIAAGLTFREVTTTIKDLFDWWNSDAVEAERRTKYNKDTQSAMAREALILEAWHKT